MTTTIRRLELLQTVARAVPVLLVMLTCSRASAQQSEADSLYQLAAHHHNNGEVAVAISLYSRVVELDSSFVDAFWNRGRLRENLSEAAADYQRVTELVPDFAPAWGNYGWTLLQQHELSGARDASRRAATRDSNEFAWWLNIGHTFLLEGVADSAQAYYDTSIQQMRSIGDLVAAQADFDLFVRNGWMTAETHPGKDWLAEQFRGWRQSQLRADSLWRVGDALRDSSAFLAAAQVFEDAVTAEETGSRVRLTDIRNTYWSSGRAYADGGDHANAVRALKASLDAFGADTLSSDRALVLAEYLESLDALDQVELILELFPQALRAAARSDQPSALAQAASAAGNALSSSLRFDEALEQHKTALHINRERGNTINVETNLANAAWALLQRGRLTEALEYYEESLSIADSLGRPTLAKRIGDVAAVEARMGNTAGALESYELALRLASDANDHERQMVISGNIGSILLDWGRYDEALSRYVKAMEFARALDDQWSIAIYLNNIGDVMGRWGRIDESITYREQALAVSESRGDDVSTATFLNNIGLLLSDSGDPEEGLVYLKRALALVRQLGMQAETSTTLLNIGGAYDDLQDRTLALAHYEEAYDIALATGSRETAAHVDNAIGLWYANEGDRPRAVEHYDRALAVHEATGNTAGAVSTLHNRGSAYARLGRPGAATNDWMTAISLLEGMRRTASFTVRRDYLQQQIGTYQLLLIHMNEIGDAAGALTAMGNMQGRSLRDQLDDDKTNEEQVVDLSSLPKQSLILNYGLATDGFVPIVVAADADRTVMRDVRIDSLQLVGAESNSDRTNALSRIITEFQSVSSRTGSTRGVSTGVSAGVSATARARNARRLELGRALYDALVLPVEPDLEGKTELVVVPDGVLAYVPFESLVMQDGSYLGEHFVIKYAQSLAVRAITLGRDYPEGRKPLIAFGGAVYASTSGGERGNVDRGKVNSDSQDGGLRGSAYARLERGGDQTDSYSSLGYGTWANLPGTLDEVTAIADIVDGSTVMTGADVNEGTVKRLSESGLLGQYKVIHFATHGMAVPEVPELSALVLSQVETRLDDGYLRMDEIADLEIRADFVNLSACETGLGKLYGGEGVVGLTQSFILAGANGLAVSLWQVSDASTSVFMEQLYQLVEYEGQSYADAIASAKRMFIDGQFGDEYRDPYYWAPFVYYGR